jgi:tetratricopeptide (TPR) repeat protein
MFDKTIKYPGKKFREVFDQEIRRFQREVNIDPDNSLAQIGLAESYINSWCYGFLSREDSIPLAKKAALQAMQLNHDSALIHTVNGIIKMIDWDWRGARQKLQHATVMNPVSYKSRHWYSLYLSAMGQHDAALREAKIANQLDAPPGAKIGYASILYFAREFELQTELLEKAILEEPDNAPLYDWLGMAYVQLREYDKSIEVYKKAVELSDGLAEIMAGLGHAYGMAGRSDEAREVLNSMLACAEKWYVPPVQIAFVYLSINELDKAFVLLERAFQERSWELVFMREEPWLDDLHSEKRFTDLVNRLNFPPKY